MITKAKLRKIAKTSPFKEPIKSKEMLVSILEQHAKLGIGCTSLILSKSFAKTLKNRPGNVQMNVYDVGDNYGFKNAVMAEFDW